VFGLLVQRPAPNTTQMNQFPTTSTAVNVQAMVLRQPGRTRPPRGLHPHPAPAEGLYGEFLRKAQGEDVVSGVRTPRPISELLKWNAGCTTTPATITTMLEKHYPHPDFEFTIQDGKLYMLQTRNGKRTGRRRFASPSQMVSEGLITKQEAILRVDPAAARSAPAPGARPGIQEIACPSWPRACRPHPPAVGTIVFTADEAVRKIQAGARYPGPQRDRSDDIHGMEVAKGILTSRGGMTATRRWSAAAWAPPACRRRGHYGRRAQEGSRVTVGGKSITFRKATGCRSMVDGRSFRRQANTLDADPSSGVLKSFMEWPTTFRGSSACAPTRTPRDAKAARRFAPRASACGRTEHMFFAEDRSPHAGHDPGGAT